jgi:TldD protein
MERAMTDNKTPQAALAEAAAVQTALGGGDSLRFASEQLLAPAGISADKLLTLAGGQAKRADFADIYLQRIASESWRLEEGEVKTGDYSLQQGAGLRAVRGDAAAYGYADEISPKSVARISEVARACATQSKRLSQTEFPARLDSALRYGAENPIANADAKAKIALLKKLDSKVRAADSRVENVIAVLAARHEIVLIAGSDGRVSADVRPLVRLSVEVLLRDAKGAAERGSAGGGARTGIDFFDDEKLAAYAGDALRQAQLKLSAAPAPAGTMPVVLGGGWAGVLLHEAVGHGLESDFNRKNQSAFSGKIGEQVAAKGVTVVDDGTLAGRRGSLNCDDEGVPAARNVLIENGMLRGYLHDLHNARLMGLAPSGNGRRQSYAHAPMPRMTNTFMPAGATPPEEIIASVKRGIYAANFNGGEVDITNGNFVFVAAEAYRIEDGKLGEVVKGATIAGNGPDVMRRISMTGSDFALDPGIGTCGKNGQWVPVGVGQPTIKIDSITVGGTAAE